MPPLPTDITTTIAFIALIVSHWLQHDDLPAWQNALIAGITFVLLAVGAILLTTGFVGTVQGNGQLLIGAFVAIAGLNEGRLLLGYLDDAPSPLVPKTAEEAKTQPMKAVKSNQ